MIKNIIFDWSGTLCDDHSRVYEANMRVFDFHNIKRMSFDEYKREFILPYMDFYKKYGLKIDKDVQDKLYTEAIYSLGFADLFPNVKESLVLFKEKGICMAVLSSNHQERLEDELYHCGIHNLFVKIKGSSHNKKDDVLELMNQCNFLPNETIFVGDMSHDIETGKHANLKTAALCWGYELKENLAKANPDHLLDDIEQLRKLF